MEDKDELGEAKQIPLEGMGEQADGTSKVQTRKPQSPYESAILDEIGNQRRQLAARGGEPGPGLTMLVNKAKEKGLIAEEEPIEGYLARAPIKGFARRARQKASRKRFAWGGRGDPEAYRKDLE